MSATVSIVVPCYNEGDVLPLLFQRLRDLPRIDGIELEIVLVDDGSTDNTWQQIHSIASNQPNWVALRLSRNFGHQRALWSGLQAAKGDAILVIDADLQDPPELLEQFVEKWREGHEVVYGVRRNRKEGIIKRTAYKFFYRLLGMLADIKIPLDTGDFCLMDRRVVNELLKFNEPNPFIRGARAWVGFDQVALEYDREARAAGKEKYGFRQLMDLAVNGLFSYSVKPLRFLMLTGIVMACVSATWILVSIFCLLITGDVFGFSASVALLGGLIGFVGGCNLLGMGMVGEYVFKTFEGMKSRPTAVIAEVADQCGSTRDDNSSLAFSVAPPAELARPNHPAANRKAA